MACAAGLARDVCAVEAFLGGEDNYLCLLLPFSFPFWAKRG